MSEAGWAPVPRLRAYEHVLAQIEERIISGELAPGDRLPPERQLASLLGVSRSAVREALRVLEAMGVLVANVGSGPDAGSVLSGTPHQALTTLLGLHIAMSNFSMVEVVETRVLLEGWAARQAALHADQEHLDVLAAILGEMGAGGMTPSRYNDLDARFHVAVAEASGNALVSQLMHGIRAAVRRQMVQAFGQVTDLDAVAEALTREHTAVYEAIRAGDPDAAAEHVEQHIRRFYDPGSQSPRPARKAGPALR